MLVNGIAKCIIAKGRYLTPDRTEDIALKRNRFKQCPDFSKNRHTAVVISRRLTSVVSFMKCLDCLERRN